VKAKEDRAGRYTVLRHNPTEACLGCPLMEGSEDADDGECEVDRRPVEDVYDPAPDWCPLRSGAVIVEAET